MNSGTEALCSRIYRGTIRHRRFLPKSHCFDYQLFQLYLDLDELDNLFRDCRWWSLERFNLASWRRQDYLEPHALPLKQAVLHRVEQQLGWRPEGPVRMLTHLRYFGYCFNPVTFYYCFDAQGQVVDAIVAEITNTPWNERHAYVLDCRSKVACVLPASTEGSPTLQFAFDKSFHVSPFNPMDMQYDWRFNTPDQRLLVHMNVLREGARHFDATLSMQAEPASPATLDRLILSFPWMTLKVAAGIYWQALRLALKRVPFYSHPQTLGADVPPSNTHTEKSHVELH